MKKKLEIYYRNKSDGEYAPLLHATTLDELIWCGVYELIFAHDDASLGLPFRFDDNEKATLVVEDNNNEGIMQGTRKVVQRLSFIERSTCTLATYIRIRCNCDGKCDWGEWSILDGASTQMLQDGSVTVQKLSSGLQERINKSANGAYWTSGPNAVTLNINKNDGTVGWQTLHAATTEKAGVMSADDMRYFDYLLSQSNILALESGGINTQGGFEANAERVRTVSFLRTPFTYMLKEGYSVALVLKYDSNGVFVGTVSAKESYEKDDFLYKISFKKNDGGAFNENENPVSSYIGFVLSEIANLGQELANNTENIYTAIGFDLKLEIGSINSTNGNYTTDSNRARSANFLRPPLYVKTNDDYLIIHALKYNKDKQFLGYVLISGQEVNIIENDDCLYKLTFKRTDNAVFSLNEVIAESKTSIVKQVDDTLLQVESVANTVSINASKIEELTPLKQIAKKTIINGVLPTSRNLENLVTLSNDNVGSEQMDDFPTTTYFRIKNVWADTHKYVLSAAVVEISNPSLLSFNTQTAVSLNCNYNTDNRYKNNICQELVRLDENIYLLYDLSGECVNGNGDEVLPTTSYIRVSANTNVTVRIRKFYCAAVDYNGDITRYRECLISTALTDYVWRDTLVSYKAVIDRNLSAGIAFWGSSSTEGDWVKNVATNLDMPYYWGGVGGENIWAIMGRMGVLPLRIETPFTIPTSASEAVELPNNYNLKVKWKGAYKDAKIWVSSSVSPEKLLVNPCYIAGVKGYLIGSGASNGEESLKFQRLEDGVAVTTRPYEPIYTFGFRETRDCVWFSACHFNGGQSSTEELVELYKKMYDVSESKKVLILGRHKVANGTVTSPTLAELQEQENALEDEFGLMFFNTREYMCGRGFERYKELYPANYTAADVSQAAQGITPDCMYESAANVHFNTRGYAILTEGITNVLVQLGYNLFRYGGDISHPVY